jgi:hypothetical protein
MKVDPDATVRDAALRKLTRINRWLIAGSFTLTAALSEVAAQAFPGKTIPTPSAAKKSSGAPRPRHRSDSSAGSSATSPGSLHPPARAPQAAPQSAPAPDSAPARQSPPAKESSPAQESAPAEKSAPAKEPAPAQEPAPTSEPPAQESPAPVVSGGS